MTSERFNLRSSGFQQFESLLQGYEQVCAYLQSCGIPLNPSSRLAAYGKILGEVVTQSHTNAEVDADFIRKVRRAAYEVDQFSVIVEALGGDEALPRHLEQVLSGQYSPDGGQSLDQARDFQFELFLAATLRRVGVNARIDEPDVLVDAEGKTFGMAAKRPRSVHSLPKIIRKACGQIEKTGLPGVVALDLTLSLTPDDQSLWVVKSVEDAPRLAEELVRQLFGRYAHLLQQGFSKIRPGGLVGGLIVFASVLMRVEAESLIGSSTRWQFSPFGGTRGSLYSPLKELSERLYAGVEQVDAGC